MKVYVFSIKLSTLEIDKAEEVVSDTLNLDNFYSWYDTDSDEVCTTSKISFEDARDKAKELCRTMAFSFQVAYQELGLQNENN